ncbi:alpha/beta fold hydrolase [Streptomyces sp. NPDC002888]|uniref:alpha/beta fold hydrolase n=1 Tax=Streptomyces sp. NPDC002888 TaxID=3364668 RepID=UPI0036C14231
MSAGIRTERALIDGLARGRALVFGNSGGAIIGPSLAALHPEAVAGLIAHEPPAVNVLPAGDRRAASSPSWPGCTREAAAPRRNAGSPRRRAARGRTAGPTTSASGSWATRTTSSAPSGRAFADFRPDEAALRSAPLPVVLAVGAEDRGTHYAGPLVEIARRTGAPWAEFPGIHMEFLRAPAHFAAALRVLATRMACHEGRVPELWEGSAQDLEQDP